MAKTLFGKALEAILSLFKENWFDFITKLWKKIPSELQEKLVDIVKIVERIKTYVDSPVVDFIASVIPGDKDDKIVSTLRAILRSIIEELKLIDTPASELKATDLHSIATRLTQEVTGLPFGQSAITIENAFQNYKA